MLRGGECYETLPIKSTKSCNQRRSAGVLLGVALSPLEDTPRGKSAEEPSGDEKEPRACEAIRQQVGERGATETAPADTDGSSGTRASCPPTLSH